MFPETDFHKYNASVFLIVGRRYYHLSKTPEQANGFIIYLNNKFHIAPGISLEDEERCYISENSRFFCEFKKIEKDKLAKILGVECIEGDINLKNDILFFLNKIALPESERTLSKQQKERYRELSYKVFEAKKVQSFVFPMIIGGDCIIMNKNIFPLDYSKSSGQVFVNGRYYVIRDGAVATTDIVEREFHRRFRKKLEDEVYAEFSEAQRSESDISINLHMSAIGASKYRCAYEYGDLGFDTSIRRVYHLIKPHYNYNTGKSYIEGQSAGTIDLVNGKLGESPRFAERPDRNSPFTTLDHMPHHLLGDGGINSGESIGNSVPERIWHLKNFAANVSRLGSFHCHNT